MQRAGPGPNGYPHKSQKLERFPTFADNSVFFQFSNIYCGQKFKIFGSRPNVFKNRLFMAADRRLAGGTWPAGLTFSGSNIFISDKIEVLNLKF
jgi:hypothetical protein